MAPDPEDRATPPDQPEKPDFEPVQIKRRRSGGLVWLFVGLGAMGAAAAAYFVFGEAMQGPKSDKVPVIRADVNPVKERPEQPGGLEIANRDKKIYDRVEGTGVQPTVERLLPEPEQPEPMPVTEAPKASASQDTMTAQEGDQTGDRIAAAPAETVEQAALPEVPEAAMAEKLTPPESPEPPKAPEAPPAAPEGVPQPLTPGTETGSAETANTPELPAAPEPVATPEPPKAEPEPAQRAALTPPKAQGGNEPFYRVQVSAVRTDEAAARAFATAQKTHSDLFAGKSLYVQRADLGEEKGIYYRVRIGPYDDKAEAEQVCSVLKARGAGCLVVRPGK